MPEEIHEKFDKAEAVVKRTGKLILKIVTVIVAIIIGVVVALEQLDYHILSDDPDEEYYEDQDIEDQKEFIQEFEYRGQEVVINLNFYEQGEIYASEKYSLKPSNIEEFRKNGYFRLKKPINIKLVHLQTTLNDR